MCELGSYAWVVYASVIVGAFTTMVGVVLLNMESICDNYSDDDDDCEDVFEGFTFSGTIVFIIGSKQFKFIKFIKPNIKKISPFVVK